MPRTTDDEVIGVLQRDYDTLNAPPLDQYVRAAGKIVDRVAACAAVKSQPFGNLDSEQLAILETWLSAHLYVQSDQNLSSKSTLGASGQFQGQTAKRLESSKYGQTCIGIDTSGCILNIFERTVASLDWVGSTVSEQTDYWNRQ